MNAQRIIHPPLRRRGRFPDKVVVITGASAGVGRATARAFARERAKVVLIARGPAGLEAARREIELGGGTALSIALDVADAKALDNAADRIERELGTIDVWVNNAMVTVFAPVDEIGADEFKRVTEVTYLGSVYGAMAALRRMRTRDRGTIVQVSSALAYRSIPLQSAYCGAKHALAGFMDALRCELAHERSNIHVTAVQMPALNTPQFGWARNKLPHRPQPVPPIFQPEVAADAILFATGAAPCRSAHRPGWPNGGNDSSPVCWTNISAAPHGADNRRRNPTITSAPTTCSRRWMPIPVRTAVSTSARADRPRRFGWKSTAARWDSACSPQARWARDCGSARETAGRVSLRPTHIDLNAIGGSSPALRRNDHDHRKPPLGDRRGIHSRTRPRR